VSARTWSPATSKRDWLAAVLVADVKVTEPAEVAQGDAAVAVKPVTTDAVVELLLGG
jgi:hypothetical protein